MVILGTCYPTKRDVSRRGVLLLPPFQQVNAFGLLPGFSRLGGFKSITL